MLEHEQAAILENYKPKTKKKTHQFNQPQGGTGNQEPQAIPSLSMHPHTGVIPRYSLRIQAADMKRIPLKETSGINIKVDDQGSSSVHPGSVTVTTNNPSGTQTEETYSYIAAMGNLHYRTLEGYFCWLQHRKLVLSLGSNQYIYIYIIIVL